MQFKHRESILDERGILEIDKTKEDFKIVWKQVVTKKMLDEQIPPRVIVNLIVSLESLFKHEIDLAIAEDRKRVVEIIERYYPEVKRASNSLTDEIAIFKIYKDIKNL